MIYVLIPLDSNIPVDYVEKCFSSINEALDSTNNQVTIVGQLGDLLPGEYEYLQKLFNMINAPKIFLGGHCCKVPDRISHLRFLMRRTSFSADDWVTFIDADDVISPNYFNAIESRSYCDAVLLNRLRRNEDGCDIKKPYLNYEPNSPEIFRNGWCGNVLWGAFYSGNLIIDVLDYIERNNLYSTFYGSELIICACINEAFASGNFSTVYDEEFTYYWVQRPSSLSVSDLYRRISIIDDVEKVPENQKIQYFLFNVKMVYRKLISLSTTMCNKFMKEVTRKHPNLVRKILDMRDTEYPRYHKYLYLSYDQKEGELGEAIVACLEKYLK